MDALPSPSSSPTTSAIPKLRSLLLLRLSRLNTHIEHLNQYSCSLSFPPHLHLPPSLHILTPSPQSNPLHPLPRHPPLHNNLHPNPPLLPPHPPIPHPQNPHHQKTHHHPLSLPLPPPPHPPLQPPPLPPSLGSPPHLHLPSLPPAPPTPRSHPTLHRIHKPRSRRHVPTP